MKVSRRNQKLFFLKNEKSSVFLTGFTMIELLIALAVFMIGIMAAFSLSLQNLNTTKENANRVIAADLAREGIETVRNIRDSNWLAREANVLDTSLNQVVIWDKDLNISYSRVNYDGNNLIGFTAPIVDFNAAINNDEAKLYIKDGFYIHDASGQPSAFRRAINLQSICLDISSKVESLSGENNLICNSGVKIGYQITSRVRYTYGSRTNTIDAVEKIYNWRQ